MSGDCINGTIAVTYNLPPGMYSTGYTFATVANAGTVIVEVVPWVDHEQTQLADTSFKFLKVGATTATTNVSVNTTSTKTGQAGMVIPAGDQYGAAAPVPCVHGYQISIESTSSVGSWEINFIASEL
jgi:hypothetical protein